MSGGSPVIISLCSVFSFSRIPEETRAIGVFSICKLQSSSLPLGAGVVNSKADPQRLDWGMEERVSDVLFELEAVPVKHERKDWTNLAAMSKIKNCPENWYWCRWEALDGGTVVTGSESTISKSGKRTWKGKDERQKVIITDADVQDQKDKYESETGNCWKCCGTSEEWAGWNHETGDSWKPCKRCDATGKRPRGDL